MSKCGLQAKDLTAKDVLAFLIDNVSADKPSVSLWDLQKAFSSFPPKVVQAKMKKLKLAGLCTGCACGCRGDFQITSKGLDRLRE